MGRHRDDTRLRWALTAALLLHAAALAAAARLPMPHVAAGGLEDIQVFDSSASVIATPVTLVDLPTTAPVPAETRNNASDEPEVAETPAGGFVRVRPLPQARPGPGTRLTPRPRQRRDTAPVGPTSPTSGGGGGGPLDLGPVSPGGTFTAPGAGGTEPGQLPGQGSGSGSGQGSGSGGGSGSGSGGGEGAGTGASKPGGSGGGGEPTPGFVSRLADRAEPEVVRKGQLRYPEAAAADGAEGTCVLTVLVGETGEVVSAEVTRSTGDRRLDKAALDFVRQWRYRPAVQEGKPRRVATRATVQFELN